jgi:hypothetical protein
MIVAIGIAVIVAGLVLRHRAERRLLARWRALEPKEWAALVRPAQRSWPFSMFVLWRRLDQPERFWEMGTPEWARYDRAAKKALILFRLAPLIMFIGGIIVIAAAST